MLTALFPPATTTAFSSSSISPLLVARTCMSTAFCQQALGLDGGESLIPETYRELNVCFEAFGKRNNPLGLRVNVAIQADGQANNQFFRLSFNDQLL
jgi:hypothetical protein